ncbi:hypothetical protein EG68_03958 [Paragonimus skrjabini miyazakii]|uniref:Uncharacterized protein n=1 Tax=Paragonimus skrjabini miyazakii TaxID=59628 RepID=A0A8S9Z1H7_9TREM|nr:hypothetical protein EG68_03958 [Paragonimus skrjabini miyazakii]
MKLSENTDPYQSSLRRDIFTSTRLSALQETREPIYNSIF